jgi:hypothetical protein
LWAGASWTFCTVMSARLPLSFLTRLSSDSSLSFSVFSHHS